eukprot:Tamp_23133.p1 GENE.Tamp_23133~~Tamp_23133.p1  ORF type:complete len:316 (+),score=52.94 Tamp_23133:22-948(+)
MPGARARSFEIATPSKARTSRVRSPGRSPPQDRSPPSSRTRKRESERASYISSDPHRATLWLLERTQAERDALKQENAMLKHKIKTLKQRLQEAKSIFDMDPHQTATRPLMRMRKRDIARPYIEKGLMSGSIYMLGEAIACGLFFHRDTGYGLYPGAILHYSVLHSTLVGMLANGPLLHLFFEVMERVVNFQSEFANVICKIVVDQVVWGCLWNSSYIFLMNLATDSPGFGYIGEGLGADAPYDLAKGFSSAFKKGFLDLHLHRELLKQGLKMLPMDIICYWIVPLRLRALWVAVGDVLWVTVLSQYD